MTEDEARELLRRMIGDQSINRWCADRGVWPPNVGGFLNRRHGPRENVLALLGLAWRVVDPSTRREVSMDQVRERLLAAVDGEPLYRWAKARGLSDVTIHNVLAGRRSPPASLLAALALTWELMPAEDEKGRQDRS